MYAGKLEKQDPGQLGLQSHQKQFLCLIQTISI